MRRRIIAAICAAMTMGVFAPPASAIFGVGGIVLDPSNLAQNIATAANTLRQINNQIQQLQNEAQMLINQAEDLANLDENAVAHLQAILERLDELMREADEITYEVETSSERYEEKYPESYEDLTNEEIVEHAIEQWQLSRGAFGRSIQVQSGIVTSIAQSRETLTTLVEQSQGATGNLAVSQAGNQLIALSVEQQMQMQQMMAAHYRMLAMEESRRIAAEERSRVLHDRFSGSGTVYTPE